MNPELRLIVTAFAAVPVVGVCQTGQKPNIIYIMCDDMGYGDLHCYGQTHIDTPNIDELASEGMRFTDAYAGSPVSAPSRACFMTGQHSGHTHVRGNKEYWQNAAKENMFGSNTDYTVIGQEPYDADHIIIPEIMQQEGYNTGMFGKWAGGYYGMEDSSRSSNSLPHLRGIHTYYGPICQFQAHSYYPNFLNRYDPDKYGDTSVVVDTLKENIRHKGVSTGSTDYENRTQYSADLVHQYALDWLERQTPEKPFFGIFTYTLPHAELWQPNDSLLQKYAARFDGTDSNYGGDFPSWYYRNYGEHAQFAAMINRLDIMVGEIRAKLKAKGLDGNTIIIFTSDNGPHEEGGADREYFDILARDGGLQGHKRSTYEGGIRIPFIACGPGIPAGTVSSHQLAFYDLMPTFCDLAGIDKNKYMKSDDVFDGISFAPVLKGDDAGQKKHEFLYWEFHETDMLGVRMGDWKMVVKKGSCKLFNLSTDLHEDNDLYSQYPKVVSRMKKIIRREHTESDLFKVTLPDFSDILDDDTDPDIVELVDCSCSSKDTYYLNDHIRIIDGNKIAY